MEPLGNQNTSPGATERRCTPAGGTEGPALPSCPSALTPERHAHPARRRRGEAPERGKEQDPHTAPSTRTVARSANPSSRLRTRKAHGVVAKGDTAAPTRKEMTEIQQRSLVFPQPGHQAWSANSLTARAIPNLVYKESGKKKKSLKYHQRKVWVAAWCVAQNKNKRAHYFRIPLHHSKKKSFKPHSVPIPNSLSKERKSALPSPVPSPGEVRIPPRHPRLEPMNATRLL